MGQGGVNWSVRRYRVEDARSLQRLHARVAGPYRPEDAAEVGAMRERARLAQLRQDRWAPIPAEERRVEDAAHLAFWVATGTDDQVIGCVGLRRIGDAETEEINVAERSCLAATHSWMQCDDIGEVRRLRVDPDWRRQGVASALMRQLTAFAAEPAQAMSALVLNTTSAQLPALALYRKLAFSELGRCYLDSYELTWMRRELSAEGCGVLE
jgi:GNAT superfamily N-acetyltransferase